MSLARRPVAVCNGLIDVRPVKEGPNLDTFWQDARHSLRVLRRSPGFTLAAVLTLGLGIAANTTIFGFMNALLLRPFPLLELDRLVSLWETHPQVASPGGPRGGDRNPLAVADYLDLEKESQRIEGLAGSSPVAPAKSFIVNDLGQASKPCLTPHPRSQLFYDPAFCLRVVPARNNTDGPTCCFSAGRMFSCS